MAQHSILLSADLCQAKAKECLYLAQQASSQSHRIMLEHIAETTPPMMHKYSIGQPVYSFRSYNANVRFGSKADILRR